MKTKKMNLIIFILLAVVLIGSGCSNQTNTNENNEDGKASKENDKSIVIRARDDPDFLDPHLMEASITEQMLLNVYEGLMEPNPDGSLSMGLAEDYDLSDDGLTYTFDIRDDALFHNGDPVNAEDVQFSLERLSGTESGEPMADVFSVVESVDIEDDSTVVITLEEPSSPFISYLTGKDGAIVPESNDGNFDQEAIGTGPFKVDHYKPGTELVMKKNEDYWKDDIPYLDEVTFNIQTDDESSFASLQGGEIDLMEIPAHRIPEVEDDFHIEYQDNNSNVLIGMNNGVEPFDDIKVRKAINYAINKEDILELAYEGYATRVGSAISPVMEDQYKEGLEHIYDQNLEKAKELLAEAGYPDGFETTITVSSHTQRYSDIAQVTVENLKEIGVDVDIDVIEFGVWLEDVYVDRDFELTAIDITAESSVFLNLNRFASDNTNNFINFENDDYDKVMKEVLKETDESKQNELYKEAQEILSEEAAAVFIGDYEFIWAMDSDLEGFQKYPIFFLDMSEMNYK